MNDTNQTMTSQPEEQATLSREGQAFSPAMTIPEQAVERDAEELLARAQYFVDCKYVARSDARQKEMGLAYIEAERADLAREIARFTTNEIKRAVPSHMGVQRPQDVRKVIVRKLAEWDTDFEAERCTDAIMDALAEAAALPHTGQPQEGDHERETPVAPPIGQER